MRRLGSIVAAVNTAGPSATSSRRQELLVTPRDRNLIWTVLIVFSNSPNRVGQQLRGIKVFGGNRAEISSPARRTPGRVCWLWGPRFSTTRRAIIMATRLRPRWKLKSNHVSVSCAREVDIVAYSGRYRNDQGALFGSIERVIGIFGDRSCSSRS